jgi:TolB protein
LRITTYLVILAVLTLGLAAAACGGGGGGGQPETPTAGGATPPSGDGTTPASGETPEGKIAFVSFEDVNQEIYVMNPDGSDKRNVTNDPATDFDPDWSPDGKQIAFVSDRSGQVQIHVMDADGSNVRQLTPDGGGGLSPRWSRDGTKIAFSQNGSIAVMDADGSNLRVVLEAEPQETAPDCKAGAFPGGWSPDDDVITYYSASVSRQEGQVCTVKVDGSDVEVVVAEEGVYNVEPVWSPDGKYIVYRAIHDGVHDIWVLDLDKGESTNVTDDPDLDIEPAWSPDGEWIVFGSLRQGEPNFDLFIMRRDGSDVRRLTDDPAKEAYPVWGP